MATDPANGLAAYDAGEPRASGSLARMLAAGGAVATITLVATTVLVWVGRGFETLPVSFARTAMGVIGLVVSSSCFGVLGALLAARVPRNPIGWLFLATGFVLATMLPVNLLVAATSEAFRPADPLLVLIAWARTTFATPLVLTLLIVSGYLFPTGRPLSLAWWGAIVATILGGLLLATAAALNPEGLVTYPSIPSPLATPAGLAPFVRIALILAVAILLVTIALAVTSLALRYRRGSSVTRMQLRWILLAVGITAATASPYVIVRYVVPVPDAVGEASAMIAQLGACSYPIAAALAVARHRLYDVDVLIGRTLVYVPLMAILAGLYAASVTLFQRVFVALTGGQSDLAVVLTALVVAGGFTPIRSMLEAAVADRFTTTNGSAATTATLEGQAAAEPRAVMATQRRHTELPATATAPPVAAPSVAAPSVAASSSRAIPVSSLLRLDDGGQVACPLAGHTVPVSRCLSCMSLQAVVTGADAAIVCNPLATRAAITA
jgi:hypothetical protein